MKKTETIQCFSGSRAGPVNNPVTPAPCLRNGVLIQIPPALIKVGDVGVGQKDKDGIETLWPITKIVRKKVTHEAPN